MRKNDLQEMMRQLMNGEIDLPGPSKIIDTLSPEDRVKMTREQRIERHMRAVQEVDSVKAGTATSHDSVRKQPTDVAVADMSTLRPISISQMEVGRVPYRGRILFCTIVTPCLLMISAMTLVEDANGDLADIAVYNLADAKKVLRVGRRLAIIEPFYKLRGDGSPGIRIDNPNEIMYDVEAPTFSSEGTAVASSVAHKSTEHFTRKPNTADTNTNGTLVIPDRRPEMHRILIGKDAIQYRDDGNAAFKDTRFDDAERLYTSALKATSPKKVAEANGLLGEKQEGVALWTLYSNRAITRIKIGKPDLALRDATMSQLCAPIGTSKPVLRCAQALAALGYRAEALTALKKETLGSFTAEEAKPLRDLEKKLESITILHVGPTRPYKSIAEAVYAAPPDAEILVDAGIYREALFFGKPITVRSTAREPDDFTPIDSVGSDCEGNGWAEIRVTSFSAVSVNVQSRSKGPVRLIGFRIVCVAPLKQSMHAINVDGSVVVLRNCAMSSSSGPVVSAFSGGRIIVENCSVYDGAQGGLLALDSATLALRRVQVCYNAACGLEVRMGGSAYLEDCSIFANGGQGITVWNKAGALEALRCEVHSHKAESGIIVSENAPSQADFRECEIYSNDFAGVAVQTKGRVRLVDCKIRHNNEGVLIQDSGNAVVEGCDVFGNSANGIFVGYDHTGKATLLKNNVYDNQGKGILVGTGRNKHVHVKGNTDLGNRGMPFILPSSVSQRYRQQKGLSSVELRRWAKKVKKSGGPPAVAVRDSAPTSPMEAAFNVLGPEITKPLVDGILGCAFCHKMPEHGSKFQKCAKCLGVCYCSRKCQIKHWKGGHKEKCTPPKAKHPSFIDPYVSV